MKQLLFFLLMNLSLCLLGQDFTISPDAFTDTFLVQIKVNYGDTISLQMYDRWGRVRKSFLDTEIVKYDFCRKDTILRLKKGVYIGSFFQNQGKYHTKFINFGNLIDSTIHYRLTVHINPESIPTETFLLYPNPVTNGNLSLVYKAEWEQSEMTILNAMGQIVQTIAAQDGNCGDAHSLLVESWASGLYYIRLRKDGKAITQSFWVR